MPASKTLISMMVDSHPPPLAKNGKVRALSIRASLVGYVSAATLRNGNTSKTPTSAARERSFRLSIVTRRLRVSPCFLFITTLNRIEGVAGIKFARAEDAGGHARCVRELVSRNLGKRVAQKYS